jgi:hypothetical protein
MHCSELVDHNGLRISEPTYENIYVAFIKN